MNKNSIWCYPLIQSQKLLKHFLKTAKRIEERVWLILYGHATLINIPFHVIIFLNKTTQTAGDRLTLYVPTWMKIKCVILAVKDIVNVWGILAHVASSIPIAKEANQPWGTKDLCVRKNTDVIVVSFSNKFFHMWESNTLSFASDSDVFISELQLLPCTHYE